MQIQNHGKGNSRLGNYASPRPDLWHAQEHYEQKRGFKEQDAFRVLTALVIPRWAYSVPYINANKEEEKSIEAQIRKAYKIVLDLPASAPNERGMAVDAFAKSMERRETPLFFQPDRLKKSGTGRQFYKTSGTKKANKRNTACSATPKERSLRFFLFPTTWI